MTVIKQTKLSKNIDNLELEIALEEQKYKLIKVAQTLTKKRNRNIPDAPISPKFDYTTPVRKGYVSSNFGKRRDPFNGRQRHHNGIDIAAKHGSKIHTIASGFVTFAGRKGAYGNVIDIHHSDTLCGFISAANTCKNNKYPYILSIPLIFHGVERLVMYFCKKNSGGPGDNFKYVWKNYKKTFW